MQRLSDAKVSAELEGLKGWTLAGTRIQREFEFPDYQSGLALVIKISEAAEAMNHHPDIELGWGRVKISLTTHSAGGLTENDFKLARAIDKL